MKTSLIPVVCLAFMMASNECNAQFDASNYRFGIEDNPSSTAAAEPIQDLSMLTGVPCNANTFYSLTATGNIEELVINGNNITSNGVIAPAAGYYSLAYCNNLNGGAFSPTFYSHLGSTYPFDYFNGSSWTPTNSPPVDFPGGTCGYGNHLYLVFADSLMEYTGTTFTKIYDPGNMVLTIGDGAVDAQGNIWTMMGNTFGNTNTIVAFSPSGQIIKQYSYVQNTINSYGCFMLNAVLYVGFGSSNPVYPNQVLPISFTTTTAVPGTPMFLNSLTYTRDFASCNPGAPLGIEDFSDQHQLNIFPNPASDFIRLPVNLTGTNTIRIFSVDGKCVRETEVSGSEKINIESLRTGMYLLELRDGEHVFHQSFVKL